MLEHPLALACCWLDQWYHFLGLLVDPLEAVYVLQVPLGGCPCVELLRTKRAVDYALSHGSLADVRLQLWRLHDQDGVQRSLHVTAMRTCVPAQLPALLLCRVRV